jgi:hypothetical protein
MNTKHLYHVDCDGRETRLLAEIERLGAQVRDLADPGHYSFEYRDRASRYTQALADLRSVYVIARQDAAAGADALRGWAGRFSGIESNMARRILDCWAAR